VIEGLLHTQTIVWILYQEALHKRNTIWRVFVFYLLAKDRVDTENVLHYFLLVVAPEGRPPHHHHVHDHASRPNIAILIIVLEEDFGGHIIRSAHTFGEHQISLFFNCNPKIDDFQDMAVSLKEHVLRFQVSMDYSLVFEI
jgi:hypothetical protein